MHTVILLACFEIFASSIFVLESVEDFHSSNCVGKVTVLENLSAGLWFVIGRTVELSFPFWEFFMTDLLWIYNRPLD